jgi:NAD(P)H-dependent FMN reductase
VKIQVIIGSTRQNRFSEKPALWIYEHAKTKPDLEVELVDLRDYPLPFFDEPMSPARLQGNYSDERVRVWSKKVAEADGYIVVSPEYNHAYPAVLKNAFDVLYPEWNYKPIGFVSYGNANGARAVEQLRLVAIELQMAPIQRAWHIPVQVLTAVLRPQEGDTSNPFDTIAWQADGFLNQLTWWVKALKAAREQQEPVKPLTPPAPPVLALRPA